MCVTQGLENLDNRITEMANSSSAQTPQVVLRGKRANAAAARVIASRNKGTAGSAPRATGSSRPGNTLVGSRETQSLRQPPIPSVASHAPASSGEAGGSARPNTHTSGPAGFGGAFIGQRGPPPPPVPQMSQTEYDTTMKLYRVRFRYHTGDGQI